MKTLQLLLAAICCTTLSFGQKVEFAGQLNTGLTKFSGESAASTTSMIYVVNPENPHGYTIMPYGNQFALSYGASLQLQRVTRNNLLFGAQAGLETLRSKIDIGGVYVHQTSYDPITSEYSASSEYKSATGKTILKNHFLNLHPYLGYRFVAGAVDLDFSIGPDIGFALRSMDKGDATTGDGSKFKTNFERTGFETDYRGRVGVTAYYRHVGVSANYAHGLISYLRGYDGISPELYTQVIRLGFLYRL